MKQRTIILSCALTVVILLGLLSETPAFAQGKDVTLTGVVEAERDDDMMNVTTATFKADGKSYRVKLDAKGLDLIEQTEGAKVEIVATETKEKNETWLTIKSFKAIIEAMPEDDNLPDEE